MSNININQNPLAELVRKNTTQAQWEVLHEMKVIADDGTLNVSALGLETADEVGLPMNGAGAVRFKGRVEARCGVEVHNVALFKDKGGKIFASSNKITKYGDGKKWTDFIPRFIHDETENLRREAWNAMINLLPTYLKQQGSI